MSKTSIINTNKQAQSEVSFDLNTCIRKCLSNITDIGTHKIICTFSPLVKSVNGDEESIILAITQLVNNAIRYSPNNKNIKIRTTAENSNIKFSVSDNGVGIPVLTLKEIRNLFAQSTFIFNSDFAGDGLYTAARIINSCGGQIGVESYVNIGSTFWFTLPY